MRVGPAPATEECVWLGLILGTAHGPPVRGREGCYRVVFSSHQEKCALLWGLPSPPPQAVPRAAAPFHSPPVVTAGSDGCEKVPGAPRWRFRSLVDTVAGCPFQARAWGATAVSRETQLSPPPLRSLRVFHEDVKRQPWSGSCRAGRARGRLHRSAHFDTRPRGGHQSHGRGQSRVLELRKQRALHPGDSEVTLS